MALELERADGHLPIWLLTSRHLPAYYCPQTSTIIPSKGNLIHFNVENLFYVLGQRHFWVIVRRTKFLQFRVLQPYKITELSRHVCSPAPSRTRSSCCSSGDGSLNVAGGCGRGMDSSKRPSVSPLPATDVLLAFTVVVVDVVETPSNLTDRWSVFCRLLLLLLWPAGIDMVGWLWWIWWMTDSHDGWWWICVAVWRAWPTRLCEEGLGSEFPTGWWRWRYSLSQPETHQGYRIT